MWNAKIDSIISDQVDGIAKVTFTYTNDDGRVVTVTERISEPSSYKRIAANKINELNRLDSVAEFIKNPPLGPIDFTPPEPTVEEVAEQDYQTKRQDLINKKQDLDLGLIEQADYDATLQATKTVTATLTKI